MVKLLEKGDLYSKIAKVSILLLICAVARGVKKKERMRFMFTFLIRCKETLQKNLASLERRGKETQERLCKTNNVIISIFALFLL